MRRIQLGKSGIYLPVIGQGTMGIGGYFKRDTSNDSKFIKSLQSGIDAGMTLIDTAEIYGEGHTEELVGQAVRNRRERVVIATKFSPEHSAYDDVISSANGSLRRLGADYIDLYQTHWSNPCVSFEETCRALQTLLNDGKVRFVGLSNAASKQVRIAREVLGERFVSLQQQYNIADRWVENDGLSLCREMQLLLLAYSPLMEGRIAPDDERRSVLDRIARLHGLSCGQVVLLWLLSRPEVVVIPKAGNDTHLLDNARCGDLVLPREDVEALDHAYREQILALPADEINVVDANNRNVYKTITEALDNRNDMTPSPREFADDLLAGAVFKPIKVRKIGAEGVHYVLMEGRLRYWAWVVAFGLSKPVPVVLV